ncbi:hypothetical protein GGQ57_000843 [Parabacteroides faecis]|uniref:Uncharacterized protein n=1 Tax=Parabacteroides faecis TaxID=1217282 RepID=A0ABR6KJI1_9BACT|nr:hypothetical protein [Parabacteroides faecis]
MTSKELYDLILSQKLSTETCICRLHHPCSASALCGLMSLNVLANTTSQWDVVSTQLMKKKIQGISEMTTYYLHCEDFDNYYRNL